MQGFRGLRGKGRAAGVVLCVALAACGGGGGGDGAATPADALTLANVRVPAVDVEVFEGADPIPAIDILADASGDLGLLSGATLAVVVEDPDQLLASTPALSLGSNGRDNLLRLSGRTENTRAGDYRGAWRVRVCLDVQCTNEAAGSPISVPYHVRVLPGLRLETAGPIAFASTFPAAGGSWSSTVRLPQGATGYQANLGTVGGDPQADPRAFSITSAGTTTFSVTSRAAPVATHTAEALLSATGVTATGRQVTLTERRAIRYTVSAGATADTVYTPAVIEVSRRVNQLAGIITPVTALSPDGRLYQEASRIEYLAPGPGGNSDARDLQWVAAVTADPGVSPAQEPFLGAFRVETQACPLDPVSGRVKCLAAGRYEALLHLRDLVNQVEGPTPLRIVLTVAP